jgi:hypothetical protein
VVVFEAAARMARCRKRPSPGQAWTLCYCFRRSTWHALDHAWEIEDRLIE